MKIQVANIPHGGIQLDFSQKDGWVREKVARALGKLHRPEAPISGHLSVVKTLENIFVTAQARLSGHGVCDRCLKPYDFEMNVRCERLLTPLFASEDRRRGESGPEVELTEEDMNFSYFRGDEIDAGEILAEQIVLEQPITYLCRLDCRGLCPRCGVNRNEKTCSCDERDPEESSFAVLRDLIKG